MRDAEDLGGPAPSVSPPSGGAPRILIADGDPDTRSLYSAALGHLATIDEAADGAEAMAKALLQPPTLLITEIRLPHVDGFTLCATLRAEVPTRHATMLIVTSSVCETTVDRAAHAGADHILLKPCAIDLLCARVDDLLRQHQTPRPCGEARRPRSV